jgi:hypothetical protein
LARLSSWADRSIASFQNPKASALIKTNKPLDVMEVEMQFVEFFDKYYQQHVTSAKKPPAIGFMFAGYDAAGVGRLLIVEFPGKKAVENKNTHDNQGASRYGKTDVIRRLIRGFDPRIGGGCQQSPLFRRGNDSSL